MYFLVDCNNFFVSCETVFAPHLRNKAVVVSSHEGGCVVARSQEAKELGIKVGDPLFTHKELLDTQRLLFVPGNHTLYADMSRRVMQILASWGFEMEVYSIDEAFLWVEDADYQTLALRIIQQIEQWTGIRVTIGIAPTKTLAKLATHKAKTEQRPCEMTLDVEAYIGWPVSQVWGIGRKLTERMEALGIYTIGALLKKGDPWIRKQFSLPTLQLVLELRGTRCRELEKRQDPQSISRTRSFVQMVTEYSVLKQKLATFTAYLGEQLRMDDLVAGQLSVFLANNRFSKTEPYNYKVLSYNLPYPTSHTPELTKVALEGLDALYQKGRHYKRMGITVQGLCHASQVPTDLFTPHNEKKEHLMETLDRVNQKMGSHTLYFAAEQAPKVPSTSSPRYTTCWDEILNIHI